MEKLFVKKIPVFCLGLAFLFCVHGMALGQDPLPSPYFPAPLFVQLKAENFNVATIDKIHDMGFRGFRRGMYWDAVEKQKGVYDFSAWDKEFSHAKEKGMIIVCSLFGGNKLHENDGLGGIQTEKGRKGFAQFAAAAVEHYKGNPILWEIWNEPNVRTFWRKDGKHNSEPFADEYTSLTKEVMSAILQKDPNAFVMAGSVSNYWPPSYEWTEMCFKKGILDTGIKGWSVHPYGVKSPEEFAIGHKITRDLLIKYGKPDMPMLDTERGFSVGEHQGGGEVANEGWSGGSAQKAHIHQAWHYVRQFMADQMAGLRLTTWYELRGDKFGILPGLPVEKAALVMVEQLSGYKFVSRIPSDRELDFGVVFENKEGSRKAVVWTAPPRDTAPDLAETHPVVLEGAAGSLSVVDLAGNVRSVSGSPLTLEISGSAQYVGLPKGTQVTRLKAP